MFERYGLIMGIIISLVIHGILLLTVKELPGYLEEKPKVAEEYTEVELIKPPPPPPPPPKEARIPAKEATEKELPPEPPEPRSEFFRRALKTRIEEMSPGESPPLSGLAVKLPPHRAEPRMDTEYAEKLSERMVRSIFEKMEEGPLPASVSPSRVIPAEVGALQREELKFQPPEVPLKMARLEPPPVLDEPDLQKPPTAWELFRIKGPAGKRKVVFRPPKPPVVELEGETEIVIKFWVLPGGEVGRAIPIKKGEPGLEAKAIGYIKEWRFNPLPPDEPQVEQEGVIPIRFTFN